MSKFLQAALGDLPHKGLATGTHDGEPAGCKGKRPHSSIPPNDWVHLVAWVAIMGSEGDRHQQQDPLELAHCAPGSEMMKASSGCGLPQLLQKGAASHTGCGGVGMETGTEARTSDPQEAEAYVHSWPAGMVSRLVGRVAFQITNSPA